MKPRKIAGDMVAAFLFGLFLWYAVNSSTTRNGSGWLEGSPWPLSDRFVVSLMLSFVIGAVDCVGLLIGMKRKSEIEVAAGLIGLELLPEPNQSQLQIERSLTLLSHWHELNYAMSGRVNGKSLTVLDLVEYYPASDQDTSSTYVEKTVILLDFVHPTCRQLAVTCVGRFSAWINVAGLSVISIRDLDQNDSTQPDPTVERFNRRYMIGSGRIVGDGSDNDPDSAKKLTEIQQAIESVISRPLVEMLVSGLGYSIEIGEQQIAIAIESKISRKAGLPQVVSEALAILDRIRRPVDPKDRLQVVIRATSGTAMTKQVGRVFGIFALGGLVGMFLAFALFAPVFFLFVEHYPWIVFAWPVFGLGVIAGCIALAYRIAGGK